MKSFIFFLLLFVVIGFATISVTLSIKGNTKILSDAGNFKVYFSDVKVDGKSDLSLVKSSTELEFYFELGKIGSMKVITYDVTNGSSVFDAVLTVSCTSGNEYLSVVNQFDSSNLTALETRRGTITLTKLKANINSDLDYSVSCSVEASPIERDSEVGGGVVSPVQPIQFDIGDIISISGEKFNVISLTDTTVTMLAQYNLGTNYKQTTIENSVTFSDSAGWVYSPGPKEIDIQQYDGSAKTYLNEYVDYLNENIEGGTVTGDLMSLNMLGKLGCSYAEDYSFGNTCYSLQCSNSIYASWLVNGQEWWTKSAFSDFSEDIWAVSADGNRGPLGSYYNDYKYYNAFSIRPVITIPIDVAKKYYTKEYEIGEVVVIGTEKFNVIDDDGSILTLLAQYNLDTDSMQTTSSNNLHFGITHGNWDFEGASREILIKDFEGQTSDYLYDYDYYLSEFINDAYIETDLITLKQLQKLGCDIPEDYAWSNDATCKNSPYISWLANGQSWWTRSSSSDNSKAVWLVTWSGGLTYGEGLSTNGVRPVVKIYKSTLAGL